MKKLLSLTLALMLLATCVTGCGLAQKGYPCPGRFQSRRNI